MPQIYDMEPTVLHPLRRKAWWEFFRPKNATASAGLQPAKLDTKDQQRCILYEIYYFTFLFHSYRAINFDNVSLLNISEKFLLYICIFVCIYLKPIPVATRSKAWVYGHLPAEIMVSNSTGSWMTSSCECCVLSGREPRDWQIHHPEEAYRLWCFWVWWWSLDKEEGPAPLGAVALWKKYI